MREIMRTWGIAIIAILLFIGGAIGNLIIDPSIPFILGLLTGAVIIALMNLGYVRFIKKEGDKEEEELL